MKFFQLFLKTSNWLNLGTPVSKSRICQVDNQDEWLQEPVVFVWKTFYFQKELKQKQTDKQKPNLPSEWWQEKKRRVDLSDPFLHFWIIANQVNMTLPSIEHSWAQKPGKLKNLLVLQADFI